MSLAAALVAACAAWVSFGTIGVDASGARIGLVPIDAWHIAIAVASGAIVLAMGVLSASPREVVLGISPLVILLLPWLPFDVPPALVVWSGATVSLIWLAAGIALAVPRVARPPGVLPRTQTIAAGVLSFVVFCTSAWFASPSLPAGDEPHYLVITQSLLYDGDLRIENNHLRGDYRAYAGGELRPDAIRRGRNGQVYSIHAPGVPALVLPAFALGGYHAVVVFLALLSSAGCALAWWLAWRVSGSAGAAWFGWAAVALCPVFLLESYTVYPDGPGATVVLTGFWALLRAEWERERRETSWKPWFFHGALLAALPWMHTRFAVLAATLGGLILVRVARTPNPAAKAIAFLATPAISALGWLAFFIVLYGTADPSAPYAGQIQSSFAYLPNGIGGLLFDQGFGLIATAPVLLCAFAGFRRVSRLAIEWTIVAIPYLVAVTTFAMWWAGWSGPARFFVPLVLPLAIPAACMWASARPPVTRAIAVGALVVTCWLSAVMVAGGSGRLGYHTRNEGGMTAAPWIEWAAPAIAAPSAAPAFVPRPVGTPLAARDAATRDGFLTLLPWIICLAAAAITVRAMAVRVLLDRAALAAFTTVTFALFVCGALAMAWQMHGAHPFNETTAQTSLLRRLGHDRVLAIDLSRRARLTAEDVVSRIRIEVPVRRLGRAGAPPNQPVATVPLIPAGDYLVRAERRGGDGVMMVGIGTDQFSLATEPAWHFDTGVRFRFPVDVYAIVVRADEEARQQLGLIRFQPLRIFPPSERLTTGVSRRAVRYGETSVFFMDDRAFPEPSAFWVGGRRDTTVAFATDRPDRAVHLNLRNAPVENRVTLTAGSWNEVLALRPGEERDVDVPLAPSRGTALLRIASEAGFRPSEAEPGNRDTRHLGVYVRVQ